MNAHNANEGYSLKVIKSIVCIYRVSTPRLRILVRDIKHVISAYELNDKEVAIACSRYIVQAYPTLLKVAAHYGLRPMNRQEMSLRTDCELQHMLYSLCIYLYDCLKAESVGCKQHTFTDALHQ